jgi:hypothetical protein
MAAEMAGDRELAGKPCLEKRWLRIAGERAADLLADLVFVMQVLLLCAWIGLWMFVL